jgi:hypothetical protein
LTTAPVVTLLVDLLRIGVRVTARDGELRARPADALTPDLRARVHEQNAELVTLFSLPPSPRAKSSAAAPVEREGGSLRYPHRPCRSCGRADRFVLTERAEEWTCARCNPPPPGERVIGSWRDVPAAKTGAMFDLREVDDVG